ncbi:MAG: phosphoesterase PA-phosphatase related [Acidimicrobiales bacterium]|nr:phosphoesterase PA-phosphatase related [Acidimicrobiales bacterium]
MTTARRLWSAAVVAALAFLLVLGVVEWSAWAVRTDRSLEARARDAGYRHLRFRHVAEAITRLGDPRLLAVVVVVAVVLLVVRRRRADAVFVASVGLTGGLLNRVAKAVIGRARPSPYRRFIVVHGQSFPSGHAMGVTVVVGALLFVLWPRLSRLARVIGAAAGALLVILVSASRVVLAAHWPADVVAGVLLGAAWVLACGAGWVSRREPAGTG